MTLSETSEGIMGDERYERGMKRAQEIIGDDALRALIDNHKDSAPHLSTYVIESIWGDLFSRTEGLDTREREMITIASLVTLGDCPGALKVHINGALNVGVTPEQVAEIITHMAGIAGVPLALRAAELAREVFCERKVTDV